MKKGFTLIELLVVVLIMGILASAAVPLYFKAVERARMMEAITLLDSISQAQMRKYMQISRYTSRAKGLDVNAATGPNAGDGNTFYTKGPQGNGFTVALSDVVTYGDGFATATRTADGDANSENLRYHYHLTRFYASDYTQCYGDNERGQELCADYCGISEPVATCCNNGEAACPPPATGFETSVH
ncbi:type IV pilin protein [Candidatus Avelusimicrobium stercoris]|uniref:type IV pilin protein n=1 Tax=Candidatus Avelusimicrobium stercoris TaxID=1947924 RepID=UPI003D0C3188